MRITLRPSMAPERELDLTAALTAAVAHALWQHGGGNEVLNWLEAERFIARLAAEAPPEPRRHPLTRSRRAESNQGKSRKARPQSERATGPIPHLG